MTILDAGLISPHRLERCPSRCEKLWVQFDAIYTAEDIGSYKPDPRNFEYLLEHLETDLGLSKSNILHTAQTLHHDHTPARAIGLDNAWIDRQGLSRGGDWGATMPVASMPETDFIFATMADMAESVAAPS